MTAKCLTHTSQGRHDRGSKLKRLPTPAGIPAGFGRYVGPIPVHISSREFDYRPPRLVLGWVAVFGRANHLRIPQSHLS